MTKEHFLSVVRDHIYTVDHNPLFPLSGLLLEAETTPEVKNFYFHPLVEGVETEAAVATLIESIVAGQNGWKLENLIELKHTKMPSAKKLFV